MALTKPFSPASEPADMSDVDANKARAGHDRVETIQNDLIVTDEIVSRVLARTKNDHAPD